MTYVYYCARCEATFEAEVEDGAPVIPELACPRCGYEHAPVVFALSSAPSACGCGSAGGVRSSGGG